VRTALLAGALLAALALTDTLARCSAFPFTSASTIARPFRPSWGACAISPRHPNHPLSQKCITGHFILRPMRFAGASQRAGGRHPPPSRPQAPRPSPRISWRLGRRPRPRARAAFLPLARRPAALRTTLPPRLCKARSIPRFGGPGEVFAPSQ